ncbi:cysteine desulfurase family protein [Phytoactinopolyspora endophytica]|uniref:cysteine desulfurase family protein n=1 Tax=Phytoactinopolyspora endophytica TaxID=1642495 RepID=UPI00197CA5F5|nr:cysteine desulfurase family protein [Phytoactinopolyspora endophytica]
MESFSDQADPRVGSGHFDAASTEALHPAAREVWLAAIDDGWADPARLYGAARRARMLLDNAREIVAAVLGSRPDEISFTSSGTQAVQLGMLGALRARERTHRGIVASAVEHSSVLHTAAYDASTSSPATSAASAGPPVQLVDVDRHGRVDAGEFAAALRPETALACLQTANHEVGTVQPVEKVTQPCQEHGVPLLVDAAQTVGRRPIPAGWSVLTASAHKWGGPPGVGVLAVRRPTRWRSPLPEDEREGGRVPGFENLPGVLAAAAALRARVEESDELAQRHWKLVERIRHEIPKRIPDVEVVGHPVQRLPHLVTFSCLYVNGEALVTELDRAGFAVNSGSSCTASTLRPSHVLEAMGVLTHGNVRVSLSRDVTADDVDRFLDVVPDVVTRLRSEAGM